MSEDSPTVDISGFEDSQVSGEDEPSFEPFNRTPKYPHETKIYFGGIFALLASAHWGFTSVWWVFAWSIGFVLPGELKKLHTYGIEPYLNKLHFKRPSLRDGGLVIGGLLLVFILLIGVVVGFMQVDMWLSEPGQSTLQSGNVEGGHLLSDAVMNWWIYGLGVLMMFLIVGPAEELMFRHQLQGGLKKRMARWKAIPVTNAIFAALHLPIIILVPNAILMLLPLVGIFMIGNVLSIQYELTDNLFVPSVTHSMYNSIILTILLVGPA